MALFRDFPCPVRRLRLERREGAWRVLGQVTVVSMTLQRAARLPRARRLRGFWWEAVDGSDRVRYRRIVRDPLAPHTEHALPGGALRRAEIDPDGARLEVAFPDLPEIETVRLFRPEGTRIEDLAPHAVILIDRSDAPRGDVQ